MPFCTRVIDVLALQEQFIDEARQSWAEAKKLPPGSERDALLKKAGQANTAANAFAWLYSPGLRPPD